MYEKLEIDYSMKNIPLSDQDEYKLQLLHKTREFLRRVRIKAYFFEKYENEENEEMEKKKETYGFKSHFNPPASKCLLEFERLMIDMVKNVKFRRYSNSFQDKMKQDIKKINKSNKVVVMADKTTNIYLLSKEEYENLLLKNVTKNYKKASEKTVDTINKEAKAIAESLQLADRINRIAEKPA